MDYKKLGLKMGLEIHQQLNTEKKLFCPCKCELTDKKPDYKLLRYLRPTQSELGKIDRAAFEESRRKLKFIYESYDYETCLVESDDEPPHPLNMEALEIAMIIASILHMNIIDEFHTMRKQVIDGSNTGGFQRTGLVATDGYLETEYGIVKIENLCLEEDAARRISQKRGKVVFRLDRLGIPLLEVTTDPSIKHPEQVKEVAYQLGQVLRSTKVKRGLGTIRQDLNISIAEGARVEIKGVQDLDLMPKMVENEVKRQLNLIKIMKELQSREATVDNEIHNLNKIFKKTESKIISKALSNGGNVLAIKLGGFKGLIGKEVQPGRRFGTELAGYAKKMGVSGIFHIDELPAYGITDVDIERIADHLKLSEYDAFIIVADEDEKARNAIMEVQRRAKTSIKEVPEETRKALEDANSEYLRPLPTASRMYVETDIPTTVISKEQINDIKSNLPELPNEKKQRIIDQYKLSEDIASQLVRLDKVENFEDIMSTSKLDPTTVGSTLAYTLKELRRDGNDVSRLDNKMLKDTFALVEDGKIVKEAVSEVIVGLCNEEGSPEQIARSLNIIMLSEKEVEKIIDEILFENSKIVEERGMGAIGALMGKSMQKLQGKADGKLVNKLLRDKIQNIK
ncbi:Glu-tRNA(Gln) amidotransferase subunit GatE [Methanobacterium spitsbergense]|uniref:Glutamyl-tRNA(Gln) amidotransferase subunit E n=1 Tax=Methanobacterium spitsbergense TaxID=2874285 RepID=A0A8T5UMU4_9EURY|nr:Glu-tRNA(Gln) amidotransferase subunit GatE [Methanobacterium spitsbergense]MBZ2165232.1 Glu-tRNA(Gln) amidotransferase subunit GatE [Methanobacterium spitsbergense]